MILEKKNNRTWKENLDSGKVGESVFEQYLNSINIEYINVTENKEFQAIDVDYLVGKDNVKVECKSDYKFGIYSYEKNKQRMFIETVQNRNINSIGWYYITECDILNVYDVVNKISYFFCMEDIREYINLYANDTDKIADVKIDKGAEGFGIYLKSYIEWLDDKEKFYKVIDM